MIYLIIREKDIKLVHGLTCTEKEAEKNGAVRIVKIDHVKKKICQFKGGKKHMIDSPKYDYPYNGTGEIK